MKSSNTNVEKLAAVVQRGFEEVVQHLEVKEQLERHERELSQVRQLLKIPEPEIFIQ